MTILAQIVPPDVDPHAVADLLDRAHEIHGHRATAFVRAADPVDLFGSVLAAAFGNPRWPTWDHPNLPVVRAAEVVLREHLHVLSLTVWSDTHSPAEQQAALAATAKHLRGEATA